MGDKPLGRDRTKQERIMSGFKVFSGGRSPFDEAHKESRRFVVLRDDVEGGYVDIAFCTSQKRPNGAWLSQRSQAFAGTGFTCEVTIGVAICRVRKDSAWVRGARMVGFLNVGKDKHFAAEMARVLIDGQIAVFTAKEAPIIHVQGRAPARDLEYQMMRFPM